MGASFGLGDTPAQTAPLRIRRKSIMKKVILTITAASALLVSQACTPTQTATVLSDISKGVNIATGLIPVLEQTGLIGGPVGTGIAVGLSGLDAVLKNFNSGKVTLAAVDASIQQVQNTIDNLPAVAGLPANVVSQINAYSTVLHTILVDLENTKATTPAASASFTVTLPSAHKAEVAKLHMKLMAALGEYHSKTGK